MTNYRIYTDLKLNPGNLNAWRKHGDGDEVSLETDRRTLRYLESCSTPEFLKQSCDCKVQPRLQCGYSIESE